MTVITPPHKLDSNNIPSIFLAGSIEMGKASNWQEETITIIEKLQKETKYFSDLIVYNPRRKDWDNSWEQKLINPNFYQQVNWELNALQKSQIIFFYFDANTISPISLLELGKFHTKAIVVVNDEYLRKGNVDIFCEKYNVPIFNSIESALKNLFKKL